MSLISNAQLTIVLDKLARWGTMSVGDPEFDAGFNAGMTAGNAAVMSGAGSLAAYVLTTSNEDVIADLLPPARDLDEANPTPPDGFLLTVPGVAKMLSALAAHLKRFGGAASLDAYLTSLNAVTPTLRAHGHFARYLKTLSAKNVFIPNDLVLATYAETGATTGTLTNITKVDTTKYAGAKLVVKNVGGLTTSAVVTVQAKKIDGTTSSITATLSTHTDAHETDFSDTTKVFTEIVSVAITTGTSADAFSLVAKSDRDISAA